MPSKSRPTGNLLIKMTMETRKLLDEAARRNHLPTGTWMRRLCLFEAQRKREQR